MQRQRIFRFSSSAIILVLFLANTSGFVKYPFISQLENWTYDARLNFTRPNTVDSRIVIVDIDENSLAKVGRWPWGRDQLAVLVNNLFDHYGVDVVSFDIVFAENDRSSGLQTFEELANNTLRENREYLEAFEKIRPDLMHDEIFARSLEKNGVVLGYYFKSRLRENEPAVVGLLPPALTQIDDLWRERLPFNQAVGYGANLAILQKSAASAGFFDNPFVDADGVYRKVPLVQLYQNQLFASLALATVQQYRQAADIEFVIESIHGEHDEEYFALENIIVDRFNIPVDERAAAYVPYRGLQGSFPYVSAHEVLDHKANPSILENKIVLIGTSAAGLLDLRSTPVQNTYPGVEVHANIISGILDDRIKHKPAWTAGYEFVLLCSLAVAMTLLMPLVSPLAAAANTLAFTGLLLTGTMIAWQSNLILPLASPLLLIVLMFILHMSYGYFIESHGKRQLANLFGHYIPPELVDEMSESPDEYSLEGESREMTVLFSDVRGFTTISEGLDPKQLTRLMNALLTPLTRVIHKHRGTIDKYMGDAIMSFWGAPMVNREHARHALYAAMEMIEALKVIQTRFHDQDWPEISVGIGINTGNMNVGNMGSEFRMAYTVLGDAVNIGSRLEGLTKHYGVDIIVSETTQAGVPEVVFRELDLVQVKGKQEPLTIFEPVGVRDNLDEEILSELNDYQQTLQYFRMQDWDRAEADFIKLNQTSPERLLYQVYLDRIAIYRRNPPDKDWDGVFIYTEK